MYLTSNWTRRHVVKLALRCPILAAAVIFLLLFTLSNHIEFTTGMAIQVSPFWHMIIEGAVMAFFAAALVYEIIRLHRRLAELRTVRTVVSTLHHEINNPLMVIQLSAEKLHDLKSYDETTVGNILDYGGRIREVVVRLSELDSHVRLRVEPGFEGLIDLQRSR